MASLRAHACAELLGSSKSRRAVLSSAQFGAGENSPTVRETASELPATATRQSIVAVDKCWYSVKTESSPMRDNKSNANHLPYYSSSGRTDLALNSDKTKLRKDRSDIGLRTTVKTG